jgi:hypothetical protein
MCCLPDETYARKPCRSNPSVVFTVHTYGLCAQHTPIVAHSADWQQSSSAGSAPHQPKGHVVDAIVKLEQDGSFDVCDYKIKGPGDAQLVTCSHRTADKCKSVCGVHEAGSTCGFGMEMLIVTSFSSSPQTHPS